MSIYPIFEQYFFLHIDILLQHKIRAAQLLDIFFYYRESMTENLIDLSEKAVNEETLLSSLNIAFPQISSLDIDKSFLNAPGLKRLTNLIKYSIPVHTYPSDLLALYELISDSYYSYIFRNQLVRRESPIPQANVSFPQNDTQAQSTQTSPQSPQNPRQKVRINYMQLSRFIHNYNQSKEIHVHQEVIRQGQMFQTWQSKEVDVLGIGKEMIKKPYKERNEKQEVKAVKQKSKNELIDIKIGKNISKETYQMKSLLIKRALNNRMISESTVLSQFEIVENQITYILNRITQEYFEEFMEELKPYASNQIYSIILAEKIIMKVLQEHNFIKIYTHLVKALKNISIFSQKNQKFKQIFHNKLQISFYQLIRRRQWQNKEQMYKKQLIGMSMFLGELIHSKVISKYIFPDLFFQLISSYIHQYQQHIQDKNFFYHQIYIQCIIKIIEIMGKRYDDLLKKKTSSNIDSICAFLLLNYQNQDMNYEEIVDYVMVLRAMNEKLPSQRFKIAFLLEDFRCNKVIKKHEEEDQNNQYEIVKSILAIDHQNTEQLKKIPKMISKCNPEIIMKDYYFQCAEGNLKQVNKNIETFKYLMENTKIIDAAVSSLKDNIEGLSLIQSDFPFLAEGIARILKQICDVNHWQWRQIDLGHPDEDVMYFIEKIESKYFKMIVQD